MGQAFADAVARATNNNAQAVAAARAQDIQKAIASALATANASVFSTGVAFYELLSSIAIVPGTVRLLCKYMMYPKADFASAVSGAGCRRHSAGFHAGHFDSGFTSNCYCVGKRARRGFWQQRTECRDGKQWVMHPGISQLCKVML